MKIYDNKDRMILEVVVDDNSYRNRAIMGDHSLTLYYSLPEHVEIPVGAYCDFQGERYTLMRPEQIKMRHTRLYEYTVTLCSEQEKLKIRKFRNTVDGRLRFPLTAKPIEHLRMLVENLNRRDEGWTVGDCIENAEKLISYDHDFCWDALGKMATEFETEFEINGKEISLSKVEYNKNTPLPLSYGKGNGFKPGLGRSNPSDQLPVEILYVQGGETNIDRSKYPVKEELRAVSNGCLLLPLNQILRFDGEHFEGEEGFNEEEARTYQVDDMGISIRNIDRELSTQAEDSLDRSEDYPKRVGEVSRVVEVDKTKNFYDFIDTSIPDNLNYEDYLIGDEKMTVIFQSGMLAGKEFEVKYHHIAKTEKGVEKAGKRFEIVPQEIDGMMMPGENFIPREHETYAIFHVMLPDSYINDMATKTGAEWDMFRAAVRYLFDNEEKKLSFTGELDGIWAKKNWVNIGDKLKPGSFIRFTHDQIAPDGALVRITNIKEYVNNPHSPKIELSNETIGANVASTIRQLESKEVVIEENHRAAIQYTKRSFRDAKETIDMVEKALSDNFSERINPIAVETMSLLVGDERLQFQFIESIDNPMAVGHNITYNPETKKLTASGGLIKHLTLGIDSISSEHKAEDYKYWNVADFTSGRLDDPSVKYYLYIHAPQHRVGPGNASYSLETDPKPFTEGNSHWLLVGVLNSEYDGERSFATLYGFTEILPGRITADRIVSSDGESWFDMLNSSMKLKDRLIFNQNGDGQLRLNGTIVQSQDGVSEAPLGCFRGNYFSGTTYYPGDEVTYSAGEDEPTSTYLCIAQTPITGKAPTDTAFWTVKAMGAEGASPALVFRGEYDHTAIYYGNRYRVDCVKLTEENAYFVAKTTAGDFYDVLPSTTSDKWRPFGASFDSVATGLLLAENANIANFIFRNERLESTSEDIEGNSNIILDGKTGISYFNGSIINPLKRITQANLKECLFFPPGDPHSLEFNFEKTGMRIMIQFTKADIIYEFGSEVNALMYFPNDIKYIGTECEIYNASPDTFGISGELVMTPKWEEINNESVLSPISIAFPPGRYCRFKCFPLIRSHFDTEYWGSATPIEGFNIFWILVEEKQL